MASDSAARPDAEHIVQVLDELRRRVDTIEGSPLRLPNANLWLHTQDQVIDWLRQQIADAINDRWEWSDE